MASWGQLSWVLTWFSKTKDSFCCIQGGNALLKCYFSFVHGKMELHSANFLHSLSKMSSRLNFKPTIFITLMIDFTILKDLIRIIMFYYPQISWATNTIPREIYRYFVVHGHVCPDCQEIKSDRLKILDWRRYVVVWTVWYYFPSLWITDSVKSCWSNSMCLGLTLSTSSNPLHFWTLLEKSRTLTLNQRLRALTILLVWQTVPKNGIRMERGVQKSALSFWLLSPPRKDCRLKEGHLKRLIVWHENTMLFQAHSFWIGVVILMMMYHDDSIKNTRHHRGDL